MDQAYYNVGYLPALLVVTRLISFKLRLTLSYIIQLN